MLRELYSADFGRNPFGQSQLLILDEAIYLCSLALSLRVVSRIENKRLLDYGWRAGGMAALRLYGSGFAIGAGLVAAMYTLEWEEHLYSFGTWALAPTRAVVAGGLWFIACAFVGIFEEGVFRGYLQVTLGSGIGFWPAAVLISCCFGLIHLPNANYTISGIGGPIGLGLLFAYCFWRTGSLWLGIGVHCLVDFCELFIFAPSHSYPSSLHLLSAELHGPGWLTGSTVGPEAGVNGYAVLMVSFVVVWISTRRYNLSSPAPAHR